MDTVLKMGKCRVCGEPIEVKDERDIKDIITGKLNVCIDCIGLELPKVKVRQELSHDDYLNSLRWKEKREKALAYARHSCQICKSEKNIGVYHNTIQRFGKEYLSDLVVLCSDCHNIVRRRMPYI